MFEYDTDKSRLKTIGAFTLICRPKRRPGKQVVAILVLETSGRDGRLIHFVRHLIVRQPSRSFEGYDKEVIGLAVNDPEFLMARVEFRNRPGLSTSVATLMVFREINIPCLEQVEPELTGSAVTGPSLLKQNFNRRQDG